VSATLTDIMPPPLPGSSMRIAFAQLRRRRFAFAGALFIACLALVAVFADLLASDLPIACKLHGQTYLLPNLTRPPILASYDCARIEDESDEGDWAIHPLVRFGPSQTSARGRIEALRAPSLALGHPFGTDDRGRDVFARTVHGARTSLTVALLAVLGFVSIGAAFGALAGFFGGMLDAVVARLVEALSAFPTVVLVLVVQALIPRPTLLTMLLAIGLSRWPEITRLVRAEVLLVASQEYVTAARALGASPLRVLIRHVSPNVKAPVVVAMTFGIASVVLIEASLSFLRVGVPPSTPSWGETLSVVRDHGEAWGLLAIPGLFVFSTVASLNLVAEALRDLLDPRLRIESLHPAMRPIGSAGKGAEAMPPSSTTASTGTR
jgi:peptide/nickel transport system permease protein